MDLERFGAQERVKPFVQQDGGDIEFVRGSGATCSESAVALRF